MNTAEQIFEQVKKLPEPVARKVLDFIGYLQEKQELEAYKNLAHAQSGSMRALWENEEDEIWNNA